MLVLFRASPDSIIKAFLASRVYSAKPMEETEARRFYFEETVHADRLDYDRLYKEYKEEHGGLDFLEDERLHEIMEDEIFWASRAKFKDRLQLIFTVLAQIERRGTKAYLAQQTPEAKEMKDRVRRVTGELRRAKRFISFAEDSRNNAIIGRGTFEHNIIDIVLRYHGKRNPGKSVVILDNEHAHILYKDEVLVDSRSRFPERIGRKDSERYWMLLSDLKHLESRRDRALEGCALPRNYWKWVSEGAQELSGSPKITLDDFAAQQES